jgi:hypothetical protein
MVSIGSGGAFNGITYMDESGELRSSADYILNRLSMVQVNQYVQIFYSRQGIACHKPAGGGNVIV